MPADGTASDHPKDTLPNVTEEETDAGGCFPAPASLMNVIETYIRSYIDSPTENLGALGPESGGPQGAGEPAVDGAQAGADAADVETAERQDSFGNDILSSMVSADTDTVVKSRVMREIRSASADAADASGANTDESGSGRRIQRQETLDPPVGLSLLSSAQWWQVLMSVPMRYRLLSRSRQWSVLYSSDIHGTSLSLLLRCCGSTHPLIMIIEDTDGVIFGCYCSDRWNLTNDSRRFFGTGECFVFTTKQHNANKQGSDTHAHGSADVAMTAAAPGDSDTAALGSAIEKRVSRREFSMRQALTIHAWSGGGAADGGRNAADGSGTNMNFQLSVPGAIVVGMGPCPGIRLADGLPLVGSSGECCTFCIPPGGLGGSEEFVANCVQVVGLVNEL